jgi:nitric-oxide synthase
LVNCPAHRGTTAHVGGTDQTSSAVVPALPDEVAPPVDLAAAESFVRLHHAEVLHTDPSERLAALRTELDRTGDYTHTGAELQWAARVAWRNADRCVGRAYWHGLRVRDLRHVHDPDRVVDETVEHARLSFNGGHIRPTMTVFAPAAPGTTGPRIVNEQLIRYAGDPRYQPLRQLAVDLGWGWDGDRWAVLLLIARTDRAGPVLRPVPADAVEEVRLEHPCFPWFAELGLRWHALPIITDMRLEAGGKWYLVPFGGWYVETEIAARNLADPDRLDLLPEIAGLLGLDRSQTWTDWRNAATVVLNQAVLWSFARDRIRISHHHVEAQRLLEHLRRERLAGRAWQENVDWSWVNLPSATPTPTFHRYYRHQPDLPLPRLVRFRPPPAPHLPRPRTPS